MTTIQRMFPKVASGFGEVKPPILAPKAHARLGLLTRPARGIPRARLLIAILAPYLALS
jgi:hypothetical protein